jgi:hypothetical protein
MIIILTPSIKLAVDINYPTRFAPGQNFESSGELSEAMGVELDLS